LFQIQRLSQYEEYFDDLVKEAHRERLREDEDIEAALIRAKQAVKRAKEESDLERIQDLFPNDSLKLYEKDVLTMRMKGLMRKRPSPAARLTRALSAKSLRPESPPRPAPQQAHRHFIMESPVQFTAGVQSQDRHLFLFNDLLLIAKARSGGNFKLKEKVRVSEIWLSQNGMEELCEVLKSRDTSFLIGWPTTNVVATFSTQAARDLWLSKLSEVVNVEKAKEPANTNIQVTFYDQATNIEYCKTLSVSPEETARGAVCAAVAALDLPRHGNYQLWAQSAREEAPYPLIGHERPAAIKLSCLRDALSAEEGFDLDHCNNVHDPLARCTFILRNACKSPDPGEKKSPKKMSNRMRIGQVFRRSLSKESPGCLFGLPLSRICQGDSLPPPVVAMLHQVATKGPFTVGMFRKSANVRIVRELRSKLDAGQPVAMDSVPVLAVGALLKEFLRSLPDPLLTTALYPKWRAAVETPNLHQRLIRIKGIIEELPPINRLLLRYVVCSLVLIARRSSTNLMSPANLGVCVGPSLLWPPAAGVPGDLRAVPALVEALISHADVLCGPNVTTLLGDPRDSGTEESDSLRRDDSSIDSLECSPPPRKDKISLSRDSGLTMSDSQLYTPDEEESGSTSSSGYDPAFDQHAKVTATMSVPGEYVRVYGGWEERLNPNFQRQAWFRQRSRRLNTQQQQPVIHSASQENLLSRTTGTALQARSASQESILDQEPPPAPPRRKDLKSFDELFDHHPPLRKVTAVHCEVISEPRRAQYRPAYTPKLPISASTVDVTKPPRLDGEDDSSTLSDDDCTPHVSRSNSRGNEVKLRHLPPVHVESSFLRGRLRRKEDQHRGSAHRSRSLPPAPAPQYANKRAPITSYYLGDCVQPHYIVTRAYRDEESYV
ncbi:unnamed protein product, partial [Nezara viridula]